MDLRKRLLMLSEFFAIVNRMHPVRSDAAGVKSSGFDAMQVID